MVHHFEYPYIFQIIRVGTLIFVKGTVSGAFSLILILNFSCDVKIIAK